MIHINLVYFNRKKKIDPRRNGDEDFSKMSRSSFASFHLTGIKPSSGKMITSSVDRLFESDAEVFMSNHFTDFQVTFLHFPKILSVVKQCLK